MIKISKESYVYVMCPAAYATGGPELLHQFAFSLRNKGVNAYMYYIPNDIDNPVHNAYEKYDVPFVREIKDDPENLLVTSEIYDHMKLAYQFKNIRKCLWWLSVDNFFISREMSSFPKKMFINTLRVVDMFGAYLFDRHFYDLPKHIMGRYANISCNEDKYLKCYMYHFYQSEYARETLLKIGLAENNIYALSDYLNDEFVASSIDAIFNKENIVLYYPRKGIVFTSKIVRKSSNEINYIPIQGFTRSQMVELLQKAKVYIDFGNHQGKDRIPREAAISKCCIITGRRGSAGNNIDVAIPDEYKFEENSVEDIINKIKECLSDYDEKIDDFQLYRDRIANEKKVFLEQIDNLFFVD